MFVLYSFAIYLLKGTEITLNSLRTGHKSTQARAVSSEIHFNSPDKTSKYIKP